MQLRGNAGHRLYVTAVISAGFLTFFAIVPDALTAFDTGPGLVWILSGAVLLAAAAPCLRPGSAVGTDLDGMGLAVPCAYALLLSAGVAPALVAVCLGGMIGQCRQRPLRAFAAGVARPLVSLATAGGVVALIAGYADVLSHPMTTPLELIALTAGGVVLYLTFVGLTATGLALAQRITVGGHVIAELGTHVPTAGVLIALAPIVVVLATGRPLLLLLLALPVVAAYHSTRALLDTEHLAVHDMLTGLPNRRLFLERLAVALREARSTSTQVAVLLIDLDRFKEVNDQLGHHVGDLLLQAVGPVLSSGVNEEVTVARLGGDEFALCLPAVDGADEAVRVAKAIISQLSHPFLIDGFTVDIGGSIGIALSPGHAEDVSTLMQRADIAMYVAKENRGGFEVYSAERDPNRRLRITSPSDLRRATELGELVIHYQPKADIRTGVARGVEALVRWDHPSLGLVGPGEFIPLAERAGLIGPLTTFVLARSLEECRRLDDAGFHLRLAVNLSVQSLYDDAFPGLVAGLLERSSFPAHRLVLDVTESTVMADPRRAQRVLAELGAMGVTLAIDDFGTGYSSLAYLKQLPVSELKVDKSFVLGMATDSDDAIIVHSTIDLGQKFGLQVVAEGVESRRVWQLLGRLGCDLAQGSFVCPPLPAADLSSWLVHNRREHAQPVDSLPALPHPS